ncbi:MAG: helix-turn-helix transcriptional regulator [Planctomycetes bacterium]|nr:helix-turn-helix transcriptional regulator [Planctomycetota bacterium]
MAAFPIGKNQPLPLVEKAGFGRSFPIGHPMASSPTPQARTAASNPDRESVGAFVRARRIAAGLTQRGLAEVVGTGTRLISEIENDKPTLRLGALNRVLAAFGKQLGCVELRREEEP